MKKKEHLALLEAQLRKPDLPAKTAAAISRRISLLKGTERTYMGTGGVQSQARKRQQQKQAEQAAQERQRREAAGELPLSFNARRCQFSLFWELVDMVAQPEFDGHIEANPDPKTALGKAMNQLWISLPELTKTQLQALAIECAQRSRIAPLSGTDTIRFSDRAERLMSNLPQLGSSNATTV